MISSVCFEKKTFSGPQTVLTRTRVETNLLQAVTLQSVNGIRYTVYEARSVNVKKTTTTYGELFPRKIFVKQVLLKKKNYLLVICTQTNIFFLPDSVFLPCDDGLDF